jgi:hypothetical protein
MSSQPLPAQAFELGTPLTEHKGKLFSRFAMAIILTGLGVFATLGGILALSEDTSLALCVGAFGLAVLAGGLFMGGRAFIERDHRVNVFQHGIIETKGGVEKIVRWDDITAIWQAVTIHKRYGMTVNTTHLYTLQMTGGGQIKFNDSIKNVEQLGNTMQQEVSNRLLPRALETLKSGGTVSFGKLSVSPQGLSNGKETIPWNEIKKVAINRGIITVRKEGKLFNWSNVTVAQTPNVFVFVSLVDRIVGINK